MRKEVYTCRGSWQKRKDVLIDTCQWWIQDFEKGGSSITSGGCLDYCDLMRGGGGGGGGGGEVLKVAKTNYKQTGMFSCFHTSTRN